jgi:hypothetical protein
VTNDARATAEADLRTFLDAMKAAGNPGSGRHELGVHKVEGWIVEYDSSVGGAEVQAIVGVDGFVHARRAERSMRVKKLTAAEWVARDGAGGVAALGARFADQLDDLITFNGVA